MMKKLENLRTAGEIAVTSSKGNQDKWLVDGRWYKLDTVAFESLAETVACQMLQKSNIETELGYKIVSYEVAQVERGGLEKTGCVSKNFLQPHQSIVTADHLLRRTIGLNYQQIIFQKATTFPQILSVFVDAVVDATSLVDFGKYLTLLFECDGLTRNIDRHLNNIAVILSPDGYDYCPIFDNGASFLLNPMDYPLDVAVKSLEKNVRAQPFRYTFGTQIRGARQLYGKQLEWDLTAQEVADLVEPHLHHYPTMFQPYLLERILDVVTIGRKNVKYEESHGTKNYRSGGGADLARG